MHTINIELADHAYPVYLGAGALSAQSLWQHHLGDGKTLIVSNDVVAPLYLDALRSALPGREAEVHVMPDGEQHKNLSTWSEIIDRLVDMQARRDVNLIALGGGVVGDMTGFAAASYMRGVKFLQVPTTLLAQVDASVGGKTGINHARGKNLIGAFHQPAAVVIDTRTLNTLPEREYRAGLAEVVKYGAIMDSEFFDWLESSSEQISQREPAALSHLIDRCVANKAKIVAADERESGIRAILNFGHSFGHAIETVTRYQRYLHGEAVAIGMVIAARLSEQRGLCAAGSSDRLRQLLSCFQLPVSLPDSLGLQELNDALELDKKALASGIRLILLNALGDAVIDRQSSATEINRAMESCRSTSG